jgi:hypothetical protein
LVLFWKNKEKLEINSTGRGKVATTGLGQDMVYWLGKVKVSFSQIIIVSDELSRTAITLSYFS